MSQDSHYCPLCKRSAAAGICSEHGVPTVPRSLLSTHRTSMPLPGTVLNNKYRLDRILGEGGMGRVYVAEQLSMQRPVAIKTLRAVLIAEEKLLARFYREARAVSRLSGPHVVAVHDFGVDEATGSPFIVMELVDGVPLSSLLEGRQALGVERATRIAGQVARTLVEASRAGIVHRDLKAENIMVSRTVDGEDFVKVLDFGIAKLASREGEGTLTETGAVIGTPRTMSPEQILGEDVDHRADLYALGCVLYRMLTGTPPFSGASRMEVITAHLTCPATPIPSSLAVPPALHALCTALLQKERAARPRTTDAVLAVLTAVERGQAVDVAAVLAGAAVQRRDSTASSMGEARTLQKPGAVMHDASTDHVSGGAPDARRRGWAPLVVAGTLGVAVAVGAALWPWEHARVVDAPPMALPTPRPTLSPPSATTAPPSASDRAAARDVRRPRLGPEQHAPLPPPVAVGSAYVVVASPIASVSIGGKARGHTPFTVRLAAGDPSVVLKLAAFGHHGRRVTVSTDSPAQQRITLRPRRAAGDRPNGGRGGGVGDRPW